MITTRENKRLQKKVTLQKKKILFSEHRKGKKKVLKAHKTRACNSVSDAAPFYLTMGLTI